MYFNVSQIQTIVTLLVGLSTVYGFISKFFADRQKKKLTEILNLIKEGFVSKVEFESFRKLAHKRLGKLELAVFMQKYPEIFEDEEDNTGETK